MNGKKRSVIEWAMETMLYLAHFKPECTTIGSYRYEDQLRHVQARLSTVTPRSMESVYDAMKTVYLFASFWKVPLEKVLPSPEEVENWITTCKNS